MAGTHSRREIHERPPAWRAVLGARRAPLPLPGDGGGLPLTGSGIPIYRAEALARVAAGFVAPVMGLDADASRELAKVF